MTHDPFERPSAVNLIASAFSDLADLLQKEIALARAEVTEKALAAVRASALFAVAAFLGLVALLLVIEGCVFVLAALGLALYWSCFLVAVVIAVIAAGLVFYARSRGGSLFPDRTVGQVREDIRTAKEQLR
ncbi:MAG TPA: phage holin family protein [Beijerinckiaceae bacterium]|nr:phage holin family protein [Beijerinckiaceae bacterium]